MRTQFIENDTEQTDAQIEATVRETAPWASKWARVEGGVRAWESVSDYETWRAQS